MVHALTPNIQSRIQSLHDGNVIPLLGLVLNCQYVRRSSFVTNLKQEKIYCLVTLKIEWTLKTENVN